MVEEFPRSADFFSLLDLFLNHLALVRAPAV